MSLPVPEHNTAVLKFTVSGPPVAMPRHRSVRGVGMRMRRDQRADDWLEAVRVAAQEAIHRSADDALRLWMMISDDGVFGQLPVRVRVDFRVPRPKKPKHGCPVTKPDVDNLAKAVLDALGNLRGQGSIMWRDDAQICELVVTKSYAVASDDEGVAVQISAL